MVFKAQLTCLWSESIIFDLFLIEELKNNVNGYKLVTVKEVVESECLTVFDWQQSF